ncbi:MAG: 1-acyl-sn-glycerol-3-phosphate acyltransferase [Alphaproteobacteria bacterium]|nr:1-acyl-sn-glycerol-3-phosphate acyltransferase [Alphaproteobacteria bacterium]
MWVLLMPVSYANLHFKFYFRTVFWIAEKVLGLKIEVRGIERVRKLEKENGCFLVLSKHQSALETFIYPAIFKEYPVFVHKKELLLIPFWGWYMAKMQMIAIDRSSGRKAISVIVEKARRTFKQKRPIIIFPEGSRTLPGEYNKYKSGFYSIYKELDLKILPIAINTGVFWNKKEFVKKSGKVVIDILPPIKSGLDKKEALELVENKIEKATKKLCK